MLSYVAPKAATGPITISGLSVIDSGVGVWNFMFPVTGGTTAEANLDADGDRDSGVKANAATVSEIVDILLSS